MKFLENFIFYKQKRHWLLLSHQYLYMINYFIPTNNYLSKSNVKKIPADYTSFRNIIVYPVYNNSTSKMKVNTQMPTSPALNFLVINPFYVTKTIGRASWYFFPFLLTVLCLFLFHSANHFV